MILYILIQPELVKWYANNRRSIKKNSRSDFCEYFSCSQLAAPKSNKIIMIVITVAQVCTTCTWLARMIYLIAWCFEECFPDQDVPLVGQRKGEVEQSLHDQYWAERLED